MKTPENVSISFRRDFINTIISYRSKFPGIFRSTECLAITISDKFQASIETESENKTLAQLDLELYTLTLLWIACKFHGYSKLRVNSFIEQLQNDENREKIKMEMIDLQKNILQKIEFEVPLYTAYDLLDFQIPPCQFVEGNRKKVLKCLKIFMDTLENGPQLSLRPELGKQFYHITKYGTGSQIAIKLYNRSKKRLLMQCQNKNK